MKKGKNKKKKVAILTAALALLMIIAGTLAATAYTEWVKNHFQSSGYEKGKVQIVEEFPKHTDLSPEMKKDIAVQNNSGTDAFVRVSYEEMLHRLPDKVGSVDTAEKGYASEALAKFPVIVNASEYVSYSGGTPVGINGYRLVTAAEIEPGPSVTLDPNLKVLVKEVGGQVTDAFLYVEKTMTKGDWPHDFDPEKDGSKIPTLSNGNWSGNELVAQKVTAKVEKLPSLKYAIGNNSAAGSADNYLVWGYGNDMAGVAVLEDDWAGVPVNVGRGGRTFTTTKAAAIVVDPSYNYVPSQVDATIKFKLPADVTDNVADIATKDWFYNSEDGYFYYTKALKAGSGKTSSVLSSILFPAKGSSTDVVADPFKIASYNLYVGLEAIPASKVALEGPTLGGAIDAANTEPVYPTSGEIKVSESHDNGFNLNPTTAASGKTKAIYDHLLTKVTVTT